ncbi:O-methyltransferase [Granulicoccus phenolivorans]|uniref:O-methyltransferase n=1 Tax=Granulicoccus phenolivorans TaxID=266854 RepID=UPI00047A1FA1|nr:O-methyltransferase [Granulicoccus phenolivorans]
MNSAANGAPAPNRGSWTYAEDFHHENEAAAAARTAATELGVVPVSKGVAGVLTLLARLIGARAVVEIGSGTGVSGLALFEGMDPAGVLTSVDSEHDHQAVARQIFTSLKIPNRRFRLISGTALEVLPKLSSGAYDLVLADGDPLEAVEYVDQALRLLRPGGVLVLHDALWHNKIADSDNQEDETIVLREAIDAVRTSTELWSTLLPVGDGMLVAVRA